MYINVSFCCGLHDFISFLSCWTHHAFLLWLVVHTCQYKRNNFRECKINFQEKKTVLITTVFCKHLVQFSQSQNDNKSVSCFDFLADSQRDAANNGWHGTECLSSKTWRNLSHDGKLIWLLLTKNTVNVTINRFSYTVSYNKSFVMAKPWVRVLCTMICDGSLSSQSSISLCGAPGYSWIVYSSLESMPE